MSVCHTEEECTEGQGGAHWPKMHMEEDMRVGLGESACEFRGAQHSESLWNEASEIRSRIEGTS